LDEALRMGMRALEIFKKSNEKSKYEDTIFVISNIYFRMHRYKDANRWYLKIKDTDNPELKGKIFINLGIVYSSIGKFDLSINMFGASLYEETRNFDKIRHMLDKAKEFAESEHLKGDIALNYAHYYEYSGDFKKSESYYQKAIRYYQSENNKILTMDALNSYGLLLMNHENVNSAKDIFKKCFELAEIMQDYTMIAKLYNNLGIVEIQLGNEKDAIFNFTKAKEIAEKINNYNIQVLALANLGDYYFSRCKIDTGFDNYKTAVNNVSFVSDKFTKLYCRIQYVKFAILYGEIDNLPDIIKKLENEILQFEDKYLLSLFLFNKLLYKFVNDMFWDKSIESEIEKIDALEKDDIKILKFIKIYFNKDNINNYIKFLIDVKDINVNEEFMNRIEDKYDLIDRNIIYKYIYDLSSGKKRDLILKWWAIASKDTGSFLIISKFLKCKINFLKETPSLQGMIRKDLNDLLAKVYKNNKKIKKYIDKLLT
jgi:tetratricopeptide (TPR) repeat protein